MTRPLLREFQSDDAFRHQMARQRLREAGELHALSTLAHLVATTSPQANARLFREIAFALTVLLVPIGFFLVPSMGPRGLVALVALVVALLLGPLVYEAWAGAGRMPAALVDAFVAEAEQARLTDAAAPLLHALGSLDTRRDLDPETRARLRDACVDALARLLPYVTDADARTLDEGAQATLCAIVADAAGDAPTFPRALTVGALLVLGSAGNVHATDDARRIADRFPDQPLGDAAREYLRLRGQP